MLSGVYCAYKKNSDSYYRASVTFRGKHISLGSYSTEKQAHEAYLLANEILSGSALFSIENYPQFCLLSLDKWIILFNFRDNNIYFKNPIYLRKRYFNYYLDTTTVLKFDADDLFYYAKHKIMKRGGHLFVSDYGMQVNILSRYGIRNFAVPGKDYFFANGDCTDYCYGNIKIINRYYGVTKEKKKGKDIYLSKIHINGNYLIGRYSTEIEAAIAYNKAVLYLESNGITKNYLQNYIDEIDEISYAAIFQRIPISKKLLRDYAVKS